MKRLIYYIASLSSLLPLSCIEEVDLDGPAATGILVVEATLTDELKAHEVKLSRTFEFQADSVPPETRALVRLESSDSETIRFTHTAEGRYLSERNFAAREGVGYQLVIETPEGITYRSETEELPGKAGIDALYAERGNNENGTDGVFIYLDGTPESDRAKYYRYEFEETYKIIAPEWTPDDFLLTDYDPCDLPSITYNLEIVPRSEEQQVCYQTVPSSMVIQNDATTLATPSIEKYKIRFLGATDFMIRHRYSILVRQYVQSLSAYSFYQSLDDFSSSAGILNSVQPGFIEGNLEAEGGRGRVIGFFEVATVSEARLFFSFQELFPDLEAMPYPDNCLVQSSPEGHISYCFQGMTGPNTCPESIVELVNQGKIAYVSPNTENLGSCPGPYAYVSRECGDCTTLGTNEVPEFWEE